MRRILLHRRATKYFRKMPQERKAQVVAALEEVATLADISTHPNIRSMSGRPEWFRLRIGTYRVILQPIEVDGEQILYADYLGPRGDAY